jgi:hypothetical protein
MLRDDIQASRAESARVAPPPRAILTRKASPLLSIGARSLLQITFHTTVD